MQSRIRTTALPFPTLCRIIDHKEEPRRGILRALTPALEDRFNDFEANVQDLSRIPTKAYRDDEKEALKHCYDGNTTALAELLTSIQDAQAPGLRNECPYCGAAKADTWDHYLPQANFPEYSVHSWNLVPCCWKCNSKKLNVVAKGGKRQIVNFYFDPVPTTRFLWTTIHWNDGIPRAEYSLRQGEIPGDTWDLILAHFKRLELLERLQEEAHRFLGYVHTSIRKRCAGRGPNFYAQHLRIEAESWAETFNVNDYRSTLYDALSAREHLRRIRDWASAEECHLAAG